MREKTQESTAKQHPHELTPQNATRELQEEGAKRHTTPEAQEHNSL